MGGKILPRESLRNCLDFFAKACNYYNCITPLLHTDDTPLSNLKQIGHMYFRDTAHFWVELRGIKTLDIDSLQGSVRKEFPMNYTTMIFSPTGGTEKAVEALTSKWGQKIHTVDLTNAAIDFSQFSFQAEDLVVIAVPSYGGRVPHLAAERIQKVRGNGANAVLVCVYGNRAYEDTLVELEDGAKAAGFRITAAVAAIAEHSIVRRFAAGRPDAEDQAILASYGQTILDRLESGTEAGTIPGNRPYKKAGGSGMTPQTGDACTQCDLCAKQCPAGAIDKNDAKTVDPTECISCMRCVAICPQHAKFLDAARLASISAMLEKVCTERKTCELY